MSEVGRLRCSDRSRAAGEPLAGTAPTADEWLLLEVGGGWPRDVAGGDGLPDRVRQSVASWLAGPSRRRKLLYVRRPGRERASTLAFVVRARESSAETRRIEVGTVDELAALDLERAGDVVEAQLVLVCGHGSRDACCARRGSSVFAALADRLGEEELWISSHQGGHRFAANVLVLPAGISLGRVDPDEAPAVVERALAGRIELDRYRGRTSYTAPVQAAEHAVRARAGLDRVSDLRLADAGGSLVRFATSDGRELAATVAEGESPPLPASCGAEPEPQRLFVAQVS